MSSTVSDSLIDAINCDAFSELENEVIIEEVKVPIINNDDTVKKIEDSRKILTADSTSSNSGYGLRGTPANSHYEETRKATATTATTAKSHGSGYSSTQSPYNRGYGYSQPAETVYSKANKASSASFKRVKNKVDEENANRDKLKSNWNVLSMMDDDKVKAMEAKLKPKKVLTKRQVDRRLFGYKFGISLTKAIMEVFFVSYEEKKRQ